MPITERLFLAAKMAVGFVGSVLAAGLVPPSACAAPPAPAAETVFFENWSEETATVNIAEDGVKGFEIGFAALGALPVIAAGMMAFSFFKLFDKYRISK